MVTTKGVRPAIVILVLLVLLAVIFLLKQNMIASPELAGKIKITASFYPLYFFASQIGGDKVEVLNITPAGSEPHDYEPTAKDIATMEDSRVIILNGNLEPWLNNVKNNIDSRKTDLLVVGEGLMDHNLNENGKSISDPHIWLSPTIATEITDKIYTAIAEADPTNMDYYKKNAAVLKQKLLELDGEYKTGLSDCKRRDIVTSHAAFGYLAADYGLNQVAIAGLSPDEEPSQNSLISITKFVREQNIKYIFFESLASPKLSDTIAKETGTGTLVLNPLEGLSEENRKSGADYFSIMKDSLSNLETALECQK